MRNSLVKSITMFFITREQHSVVKNHLLQARFSQKDIEIIPHTTIWKFVNGIDTDTCSGLTKVIFLAEAEGGKTSAAVLGNYAQLSC